MRSKIMLLAALSLSLVTCKKDEDEPEPTPATTGTFSASFGFHWGGPDFELGTTYADGAGNAIVVDTLMFFLSDFHLMNAGSIVGDFHDKVVLVSAEEESIVVIGTMSASSVDTIHVTLGLESALNHADPATAEPPLDDATMHLGSTAAGYTFLLLEGRVDDDGDGTVDAGDPVFLYRCATDAALREIEAPLATSVSAGSNTINHIHMHVDELFTGINTLATPWATGYDPINQQLMDNLAIATEAE